MVGKENDMGSIGNIRTINTLLDNNPKLEKVVEKAFDKANLMGEDADLYKVLYSYKTISNLPESDIEIIYEYLSNRLYGSRY